MCSTFPSCLLTKWSSGWTSHWPAGVVTSCTNGGPRGPPRQQPSQGVSGRCHSTLPTDCSPTSTPLARGAAQSEHAKAGVMPHSLRRRSGGLPAGTSRGPGAPGTQSPTAAQSAAGHPPPGRCRQGKGSRPLNASQYSTAYGIYVSIPARLAQHAQQQPGCNCQDL